MYTPGPSNANELSGLLSDHDADTHTSSFDPNAGNAVRELAEGEHSMSTMMIVSPSKHVKSGKALYKEARQAAKKDLTAEQSNMNPETAVAATDKATTSSNTGSLEDAAKEFESLVSDGTPNAVLKPVLVDDLEDDDVIKTDNVWATSFKMRGVGTLRDEKKMGHAEEMRVIKERENWYRNKVQTDQYDLEDLMRVVVTSYYNGAYRTQEVYITIREARDMAIPRAIFLSLKQAIRSIHKK